MGRREYFLIHLNMLPFLSLTFISLSPQLYSISSQAYYILGFLLQTNTSRSTYHFIAFFVFGYKRDTFHTKEIESGYIQQEQQQLNNMMEHHHHQNDSMNQTHNNNNSIVEHVIHHNLSMDHHNNTNHHQQHPFLPIYHNYMAAEGAVASSSYYPVNFTLGLNEINCASSKERDAVSKYNARHTSIETHIQHCWPQNSSSIIKQTQHFWEPLPAEVSNEKSEIIVENNIKMNQKQPLQRCSNNSKPSLVYGELGELEAIYKRCGTTIINQTLDGVLSRGQEQGSDEASIDASVCLKDNRQEDNRKKMKKKKRKGRTGCNEMVQFFEKLVKQVVDHQENIHTKFVEKMERLDVERREKEEAWRNRELVYFEQQAAARARENAVAATREDAIVSYLEKITGLNIPSLPSSFNPSS